MSKSYCDNCQIYMKTCEMAILPASAKYRKFKKSDVAERAAYDAEQTQAAEQVKAHLKQFSEMAIAHDGAGFLQRIRELSDNSGSTNSLPRRLHVAIVHCKGCGCGNVTFSLVSGQGKKRKIEKLPAVPVEKTFVDGALAF